MLSEIVARAYCPAAVSAAPDRFFSVGCHSVGSHWLPSDAADAASVASQVRAMERTGHLPWEPDQSLDEIFNDLFSPFRDEFDGRLSIWIPVPIEEPLSSTLLAHDWRVFALAWWAARRLGVDPSRRITVTAFDAAGRTVSAEIKAEDLYSAMELAATLGPVAHETPGAGCASCSRAPVCKGLAAFTEDYGPMPKPVRNEADTARAARLFSERSLVSLRLELLEKRKATIESELGKMVREGILRLGDDQDLEIPTRTTAAWDFGMVHRALMSRGLWDDSLGSVRGSELQKAMERFPGDLVKEIGKARSERVSQPSISEAARHGRFATRAPFLGGVPIRRQGGVGQS